MISAEKASKSRLPQPFRPSLSLHYVNLNRLRRQRRLAAPFAFHIFFLKCLILLRFCSQPGCFGEIDTEPIAPSLIAAGHFGRGVAEMALDVGFVDLGGGGEAGT